MEKRRGLFIMRWIMTSWIDERMSYNLQIANQILPDLYELRRKYPAEKETLNNIIEELESGFFGEDFLLEIRNKLRRFITKDEYNLIRKKDDIWNVNNKIKQLESRQKGDLEAESESCFFDGFDFKIGDNFYYLKCPKLSVYSDKKERSELMLDRYIRDFISNSLSNYQAQNNIKLEIFETFSLVILHHIKPENAKKYDTDNIEIKKPIDGINGRLIRNDTADRSDIFQIIVPDNEEYTEIYVLKGHGLGKSIIRLLNGLKQ